MALNQATLKADYVATIKAKFNEYPFTDDDWLNRFCDALAEVIIRRIKEDADIKLQAGDIPINPGTFIDSLTNPITGQGVNAAVTLNQRIE